MPTASINISKSSHECKISLSFSSTTMAKVDKKSRKRIGYSSFFLGCFGISRKIYSDERKDAAEDGGNQKTMMKKKRSRWFLCSKFRMKSGEIKSAPIEETEKLTPRVEDETDKQRPIPVIRSTTDHENSPADDKTINDKTETTKPNDLEDRTLDRSELDSSKEDTFQEKISNLTRFKKFDPVIGISIIITTLVVMLIWGRLCAILCSSACCYFLPRLRDAAALAKRKRSGSTYVLDLNSEFQKIKIVLDRFLGRQNRVSAL